MARAKRHFIPGHVWHLTQRCHKREFLLKFVKDRRRWLQWLFEAKKRYGLVILNYMATSNHVHLIVFADSDRNVIPRSVQLIAGRTGQEYNQRKNRKGAFWEDRYHATAVERGRHLLQRLVYIDLNMVRAGVVRHPSQWDCSGYSEVQQPRQRYGLIDHNKLMDLLGMDSFENLREAHRNWVEDSLRDGRSARESKWTRSIAVGSESFVEEIKRELGAKAKGRRMLENEEGYELREAAASYRAVFAGENGALRPENTHFWDVYSDMSNT